uniref:cell surface glycoprotein CD200 receptor 1-A-like isoform X2 n=1 Tax=Scatophagus argus TaxID=75038 RepID=UPI001ED82E0D|nr:cell surface glycoprotein CD200 receptor 1-A-like isoform X2 [Scatophagus argus]
MRAVMWIYAAFVLLLPEAWSLNPVVRHSAFNLGSDVNLTCSNKTWSEMIFVIWTINLKSRDCRIGFSNENQKEDSCNDGKSLRNTSRSQSYLHIPKISNDDEGIYKCESVYSGGSESYEINVAITVPPTISAWLERKDNKIVAVCRADKGKPAANISWSRTGNSSETLLDSNGFFTVESRLELLGGMDTKNLSCAFRHPYWREDKVLVPEFRKGYNPLLFIPFVVVVIVFMVGILILAQKKLMHRRCQQSNTSLSKSAPTEDVEEVEPYASYVQRVNSIYNSSADLFT